MKHKSQLDRHPLDTEEVKNLDLDEQPKPTKKLGSPGLPSVETSQNHKRLKGVTKKR
ncbi:MAG: hypothetical protein ABI361_08020 [Nitrososphaera sp.]|jgi:hypothetical protein